MNEKIKNVIIVILICIICVLTFTLAFILGMKFDDKKENINNANNVNDEEVQDDIKVVDYINKSLDKNTIDKSILEKYLICGTFVATEAELGTTKVRLPMLDSSKAGAKTFNKTIQEKYAKTIDELDSNSKIYTELNPSDGKSVSYVFGGSSTDYEYYNSDKYISVIITHSHGSLCASGGSGKESYVYSIEEDMYLTNEDVIKEFNITKDKIKTKFIEKSPDLASDSYLESSLNDSFEDLYYLYIEEGFLNIGSNSGGMDPASRPTIQIPIN